MSLLLRRSRPPTARLTRAAAGGMLVLSLFTTSVASAASEVSTHAPEPTLKLAAAQQALTQAVLAGHGQMRFFGLRIYDARLWVGPQFQAARFWDYPLVLQLTYHRSFSAQSIAQRSVQEIERQQALTPAQATHWQAQLAQVIPNVQSGDQVTGIYLPGQGMQFWQDQKMLGALPDAELARAFFGIWLSPQTSEPQLRKALLSNRPGNPP